MARVLVVEDERKVRRSLREVLAQAAYEVATAADGDEASQLALGPHFDCIVLDVMLPGRSGQNSFVVAFGDVSISVHHL